MWDSFFQVKNFLTEIFKQDMSIKLSLYMRTLFQSYTQALHILDSFNDLKLPPEMLSQDSIMTKLFSDEMRNYSDNEHNNLKYLYQQELSMVSIYNLVYIRFNHYRLNYISDYFTGAIRSEKAKSNRGNSDGVSH